MPLRLPSLGAVVAAALTTARRFPLVLLCGVLAALAAILSAEELGPDALRERLLSTSVLGLPLFLAVALAAERKAARRWAQLGGALAAALVLGLFYLGWAGWSDPVRGTRFAQLLAAFAALAIVLPFAADGRPNAFWQYIRALLERGVLSAISAVTIFAGLALALAALDRLFGVDVPGTAYARVWVVTVFVITTWFFLGGVPADLGALEARRDYPAFLRVFAQFTLVPLVTIYLVILTLYLAKVVVTWDWPSGWIGWLVSGVAAAGVVTLLLVHPLAEDPEQQWIRTFARAFWIAVLPAIVMLWLALYQRIAQYGITEPRYFLGVASLWFAGVAVYHAIARPRGIRLIPVTLGAVTLLAFAGPWSAYRVAERSQLSRLRGVLARNGMFEGGRVRPSAAAVPVADRQEISAALRYLIGHHGTGSLVPWFGDSLAVRLGLRAGRVGASGVESRVRVMTAVLGVPYASPWERSRPGEAGFSFRIGTRSAVSVAGFELLAPIEPTADLAGAADTAVRAVLVTDRRVVRVLRGRDQLLELALDPLLERLRVVSPERWRHNVPQGLLTLDGENDLVRARVLLRALAGADSAGLTRLHEVTGDVLVTVKR